MLDIKLFRTEPDRVRNGLARRLSDPNLVQPVVDIDTSLRAVKTEVEDFKAELNQVSKRIPLLMREGKRDEAEEAKARGRELGEKITALDEKGRLLQSEIDDLLFKIPNLPSDDTPEGPEENFKIVRTAGTPRAFDFAPKAHWDIATGLGLIDFARGTKLAGSGFVLYRGMGARLERALIQFMIDLHIERHGYTEWATPFFLSRDSMKASCHLAKFTPEMYHDDEDDLFALPTAEPALINIHRDEILDGKDLPLKYVAYSPCWRREAGAAGKDTRGLLRVHQFDKVEMVKYTLPETSYEETDLLLKDATDVIEALGLPYRIKLLAAGDISFSAAKCYDVETYAPGVDSWLEVSSCSNCEDFQSRQGNIRFRREAGGKTEFPHLLNCSGTALPRVVATLLETYQNEDGSVTIPEPLRPYLYGREKLTKEA
jgi:seryl-tRNA synthetase